jgi:hypothetical protein
MSGAMDIHIAEMCRKQDEIETLETRIKELEAQRLGFIKTKLEDEARIKELEGAILKYRTFRWKPDARGWCLPYGDEEKKLFAILHKGKPHE